MVNITRGFSLSAVQLMPETDSLKHPPLLLSLSLTHFVLSILILKTPRIFVA